MSGALAGDRSAAALLQALLLGAAIGLLYDVLRPLRRRVGRAAPVFDGLFSLLAGIAAFCFAMAAGDGRLGIWELGSMLLGFLLWEYILCRFKQLFSWFVSWIRIKKQV